jgi:hypothetical protein
VITSCLSYRKAKYEHRNTHKLTLEILDANERLLAAKPASIATHCLRFDSRQFKNSSLVERFDQVLLNLRLSRSPTF